MAEDFRNIASEYATLSSEITRLNRASRDLKAQKDTIGDSLLEYLKTKDIDEVQLPTGGKIVRKTSKRTSPLKKEYILEELQTIFGGDVAKAEASLQNIQSKREVIEKEVISLSLRGVRSRDDDDDE
jgi:hypothetical protein